MKRVAIYTRVSTDQQTTDNQERELRAIAARAGWAIVQVYCDHGISGTKGREGRPAYDRLCKDAARREFDLVAAWAVDRLGRSLQDLAAFLGNLHSLGIDLYLHQQGLDTTSPAGRAMFGMMAVFAEFERALIRERVNSGLARARAQGKRLGRPATATEKVDAIKKAIACGDKGLLKIAAEFGVGSSTVQRIKAELQIDSASR